MLDKALKIDCYITKGKDMTTAHVRFNALHQISQNIGSNDDHMISRIHFDLNIDGQVFSGLYADIKQPVGSNYAETSLEVSKPVGYDGPFNFEAFSQGAEDYYRKQQNSMFGFEGGSNIHMSNNISIGGGGQQSIISFEISEEDNTW